MVYPSKLTDTGHRSTSKVQAQMSGDRKRKEERGQKIEVYSQLSAMSALSTPALYHGPIPGFSLLSVGEQLRQMYFLGFQCIASLDNFYNNL